RPPPAAPRSRAAARSARRPRRAPPAARGASRPRGPARAPRAPPPRAPPRRSHRGRAAGRRAGLRACRTSLGPHSLRLEREAARLELDRRQAHRGGLRWAAWDEPDRGEGAGRLTVELREPHAAVARAVLARLLDAALEQRDGPPQVPAVEVLAAHGDL